MNNSKELIDRYVLHASEHGKATRTGDFKKTNKHHDELLIALNELLNLGGEGNKLLLSLLQHKNESVSLWAASHALKIDEKQAKAKLKEVMDSSSFFNFDAEMVLQEWKTGNL